MERTAQLDQNKSAQQAADYSRNDQATTQAQSAQASKDQAINTYYRAYGACMQGRGYTELDGEQAVSEGAGEDMHPWFERFVAGTVGVVGPMRIEYARTIAAVNYIFSASGRKQRGQSDFELLKEIAAELPLVRSRLLTHGGLRESLSRRSAPLREVGVLVLERHDLLETPERHLDGRDEIALLERLDEVGEGAGIPGLLDQDEPAKVADWLPASEFSIRRSYTFNESEVLARNEQEQL